MYYVVCSYSKGSLGKENVIRNIIRKRTYRTVHIEKNLHVLIGHVWFILTLFMG